LVIVNLDLYRATVSESTDRPVRRHLYLYVAVLSATALTAAHDESLSGVSEILGVRVVALEASEPLPGELPDAGSS
jgi:hypothetical protein